MCGEEFHGDDFRSNNLRQRADVVRSIPLADVLAQWGADRDRPDRSRWHTERGPVSITGSKFFNWHLQQGGGTADGEERYILGLTPAALPCAFLCSWRGLHTQCPDIMLGVLITYVGIVGACYQASIGIFA